MNPITSMDATALAASIRDGVLTSAGVVQACLDRIDEVNGKLGVVTVTFAEQARREAVEADARQASGAVAPQDAPPVLALRRAGAIVLGRTNMPDFATRWHTDNDLRGPTINPWDRGRSPGGSSGGDAVAVAAGMVLIGLGGDYGGSLRVPANACGVAALRATPGRVPRASSLPGPSPSMTNQLFAADGPLARSVRDLSLVFDVIRARDDRDPNWVPAVESPDQRMPAVAVTADPCGEGVDSTHFSKSALTPDTRGNSARFFVASAASSAPSSTHVIRYPRRASGSVALPLPGPISRIASSAVMPVSVMSSSYSASGAPAAPRDRAARRRRKSS
jgi:Asp-tRNA(Asn)/Glu-tRNA(Gln) amidotransferase A subunit family amidase